MFCTLQAKNLYSKCNLVSIQSNTRSTFVKKQSSSQRFHRSVAGSWGIFPYMLKEMAAKLNNFSSPLRNKEQHPSKFLGVGMGEESKGEYLCLYTAKYIEQTIAHWPGKKRLFQLTALSIFILKS